MNIKKKKTVYELNEVMDYFKNELKCADCEMNFGGLCAGKYYGKALTEDDCEEPLCDGYDISLNTYMELEAEMHKELKNGREFN